MKNISTKSFLGTITFILLLTTAVVSCDKDDPVITVTGISLNKTELTKTIGETEQLTATVAPTDAADKTVTWSSSNEAVATVAANGTVTAVAAGTANITVTTKDGNKTAVCTVTVKSPYTVKFGEEWEEEITGAYAIHYGKDEGENAYWTTLYLTTGTANIFTEEGSGYVVSLYIFSDKESLTPGTYTWDDENYDPFTYNEESALQVFKNGSFAGDGDPISSGGTITITAINETHYEVSFDLTVHNSKGLKIKLTGSYSGYIGTKTIAVTGVSLNKTEITKTVGQTEQLTATIAPYRATNKKVTWSSSNEAVAAVAANGTVTAVAAGTANITVTTQDGNKTAVCTVTVKENTADNFKIEGTIVTDKTIASDNTAQVFIVDFGDDDDDDDDDAILVGSSTISNKAFSIAIDNPENSLVDVALSVIREKNGSYITKLECENSSIKVGAITGIAILNSGTNVSNLEGAMLCTNEGKTITYTSSGETITEWFVPHGIAYFYANADFTYYKNRENPEDLDPEEVATIFALDLKKGWNLVKVDHEYTNDSGIVCTKFESTNEVPQDYEWRLISDLFPNMVNSPRNVTTLSNNIKNITIK